MRRLVLLGRSGMVRLMVLGAVFTVAGLTLAATSSAAGCPAGAVQFTGAVSDAWNVAGNWSNNQIPGSGTDACWPSGVTVVDPSTDSSERYAHSITGGSLEIDGGAINLGVASSVDSLTMTGGGLEGNGQNTSPLTVNGPINWSGGTIGGENGIYVNQTSGNITIDGAGQAKISSDAVSTTGNVTITNTNFGGYGSGQVIAAGTISFTPGTYAGGPGPTVGSGIVTYQATGFSFSGATTLPQATLTQSGGSFALSSDVTVQSFNSVSGSTMTVGAAGDLTADSGTISGTVTGQGTYTEVGSSNETISGGGVMSIDNVALPSGFIEVGAGGSDTGGTYSVQSTIIGTGHLSVTTTGTASTGDLTINGSTGSVANGTLSVTGNFLMTGGDLGNNVVVDQTGSGTATFSGTSAITLSTSSLFETTSPITVSNLALTSFMTASIHTTSTIDFVAGTYSNNGILHFSAAGYDFGSGTTSMPGYRLTFTGGTTTIPAGSSVSLNQPTMSSGTLEVDGTLTISGPMALSGGTVTGTGTIVGDITNSGGTISPGDAPGTLTETGNYVQTTSGNLSMIVNGAGAGQYSVFAVSGSVSLGGNLTIVAATGFSAAPGIGIPFLTYGGTRSGTFVTTSVSPAPSDGDTFTVDYSGTGSVGANVASGSSSTTPQPGTPGPVINGSTVVGSTLTTTNGTWTNGPSGFTYQWEDCDSSGGSCSNIASATSGSYLLGATDAGHTIRVLVTATGATGPATAPATAIVTTTISSGSVPANSAVPQITGTPALGQLLTCSDGTWTGSPSSFALEWNRNGSAIGNATAPTYTVVSADQGDQLTCTVTASNSTGPGSPATSAVVSVPAATSTVVSVTATTPTGSAPTSTALPEISGTPLPGHTLTCSVGTWTGSPKSFALQWKRGGAAIAGATGASYAVQIGDEAASLTCTAIASNAAGPSSPSTSNAVQVGSPGTLTCVKPTGSLNGSKLGPFTLGMTVAKAHKAITSHKTVKGHDDYCLYGGFDIEAGARKGKVVVLMTSNIHYALAGIKPGATLTAAKQRLKLGTAFVTGGNDWYFAGGDVVKVRGGVVQEIGIASKSLLGTTKAKQGFVTSFSAL